MIGQRNNPSDRPIVLMRIHQDRVARDVRRNHRSDDRSLNWRMHIVGYALRSHPTYGLRPTKATEEPQITRNHLLCTEQVSNGLTQCMCICTGTNLCIFPHSSHVKHMPIFYYLIELLYALLSNNYPKSKTLTEQCFLYLDSIKLFIYKFSNDYKVLIMGKGRNGIAIFDISITIIVQIKKCDDN